MNEMSDIIVFKLPLENHVSCNSTHAMTTYCRTVIIFEVRITEVEMSIRNKQLLTKSS